MKLWIPACVITFSAFAALSFPALANGLEGSDIYGRIILTLDRVDHDTELPNQDFSEWQLNSRSSRVGLKGESTLSEGVTAIYQMEFGVNIDGDGSTFSARNAYLGLRGAYGTILAGKHDTPTKLIQNGIDQFDNFAGDLSYVLEGDNRMNDMVMYSSPVLGGAFTVSAAIIPGEDNADGVNDAGVSGDSLADGQSVSIEYEPSESFLLALGVDRDVNGLDLERLAARFRFGKFQLGAMFEQYENELETLSMRAGLASLGYTVDRHVFKVQGGLADSRIDDGERESYSIGYDYLLANAARVVSYVTINKDENALGVETKETVFGIGMDYRF